MASVEKICRLCSEDCSDRARTRDAKGHYYCQDCYAKALQRQRVLKAREEELDAVEEMPLHLETLDATSDIRVMPVAPRPPRKKLVNWSKISFGDWQGPLITASMLSLTFIVAGGYAVMTGHERTAGLVILLAFGWAGLHWLWSVAAAFFEGGALHGVLTLVLPGYMIYSWIRSEDRLLRAMIAPVFIGSFTAATVVMVVVVPIVVEEQRLAADGFDGFAAMPLSTAEEEYLRTGSQTTPVVDFFNDPVMAQKAAQLEAQRLLKSFHAGMDMGWRGAKYSVCLERSYGTARPGEAAQTELVWVDDVTFKGANFHGVARTTARHLPGIRGGSAVTLTEDEVADWLIVRGDIAYGGFTLIAARDLMTRAQVRRWKSKNPWKFTAVHF